MLPHTPTRGDADADRRHRRSQASDTAAALAAKTEQADRLQVKLEGQLEVALAAKTEQAERLQSQLQVALALVERTQEVGQLEGKLEEAMQTLIAQTTRQGAQPTRLRDGSKGDTGTAGIVQTFRAALRLDRVS